MKFLNFSEANCKNCYKCLRHCPVKAIKIKNGQANIVEERCIGCGQCLVVCPQEARNVKSDLNEVKEAINNKKRVIASIAPSFAGAFELKSGGEIVTALKKMGFSIVEETAIGAEVVAKLYKDYITDGESENLITTSCPSANYLIEKYFPSLVKYMIPVVSPMIAHGKMIKHKYGMDSYVVFIGPCTSKKIEAVNFQHKGIIDAVLTFEELSDWFLEEGIKLNELKPQSFDAQAHKKGRGFPIGGGVIKSFLNDTIEKKYDYIAVDGIKECMNLFESLSSGNINNVCLEVNVCKGSCIGGPAMPKEASDYYKRLNKVKDFINKRVDYSENEYEYDTQSIDFSKKFFDRNIGKQKASEEEINKILRKMGKYEKADELNCGACGYNTCREKAQAVYEGMAEMEMCLPYMRSKAESLNNIIVENSPNAIILVDDEMRVKEFNPTAERIFNIKAENIMDKPISILIDDSKFSEVKESKKSILKQKVSYPAYGVVLMQNIVYLKKQNVILAIMVDITAEETNRKELMRVRENTLDAAQSVIEKQMRVAQEIASLLGETTAETKMILTKLKQLTMGETGDIK
ncbi:[Fe-Fe] hydrogenase large subunit C-terminal domain-containing protein [Caldisalinibacter kiritimatiensis]|uniref:Periplasmic [Fe] hydrogenase n=1 Tax=Caldisalinibacter kiritimatiensis TaxID=1304284 RepID=R1CRU7_9FIRM|nr:[Fe-Fe] hydrogenase large subunit C-terminal domain-containing protein [Caldisalinibacter kiritimatiensis]EOD01396.1 Periplasmic [Fe] hydrogenase [Caldisalinibacter kiritimatiensis]